MPHGQDLEPPAYASKFAAGMDLRAAVSDSVKLFPGERKLIPTGFAMQMEPGYEAQIRPRSGLALKHGVTVLNAPGTVDADYRGEVGVLLINLGDQPFTIERGDRIAQMVISPMCQARWEIVPTLESSGRGRGGYGHTGVR
ncbi:putative deoxyuridine 5'-triphosphate nucleotidohydrolase [Magnetofaba australis IT-1]|uniref:Deoxyuridine 5'-triphosphate nucleotidohydrolase n=2 Tax=Magnetofaba TaxID=1472292 RepID=A0A1Y2K7U0_9PROT|nr:putative deoxyuridine 5'-triphosphate nucleotidohydrolase [Magnetofaba australis IT-1]